MKRVCALDFSQLPTIEGMDILIRLERDVRAVLSESNSLFEVNERSQAALMFIFGAAEDKEAWRNSAMLRAGLNEFYSIEDAARRDFKKNLLGLTPPAIRDSKNPLVHLMYLLRHVNVHAHVSRTRVHHTSVTHTHHGKTTEVAWGAVVLDTPTLEQLQRCKEAKEYYAPEDLARAAAWLDDIQHTFGIGEVFRRGLSAYCREIVAVSGLLPESTKPTPTGEHAGS